MQYRKTTYELRKFLGSIKPINSISKPVIIKHFKGYWIDFWTCEEVIVGEKKDEKGNLLKFIEYY